MLYFRLKLSEEYDYSYEIDEISNNIKDLIQKILYFVHPIIIYLMKIKV